MFGEDVLLEILGRKDSAQARLELVCFMAGHAKDEIFRGGVYGAYGSINFTSLQHVCVDDWSLIVASARQYFGV